MYLKLTKDVEGLKERIAHIEAQLDNNTIDKYATVLDKNYKKLSDDIYKLQELEKAGGYLLQALPKESREKVMMVTQKEFDAREANKTVEFDEDIFAIVKVENNQYKSNDVVITKELIGEQSELGDLLRQYQKLRDKLKFEQSQYKQGKKFSYPMWLVNNHLSTVKGDMIQCIISYKGLDYERPKPTKRASIDLDIIEYGQPEVIKEILKIIPLEMELAPDNELSHIAEDLRASIRKLNRQQKLDKIDNIIIREINCGTSLRDIAQLVGINHVSVNKRLNNICKKISNQLEGI